MPEVRDTTRTWLIGSHPIYNHDDDGDRGQYWYGGDKARANLLFCDMHVKLTLDVPSNPGEILNTTKDYTFLP
jgi:hypothetical protein